MQVDRPVPPATAPKDYTEMYQNYFGYIRSLCVKYGINYEDVNDVAHDLICRIMERGLLEGFDPARRTYGDPDRAKRDMFTAMVTNFVSKSLLNYRDKQGVRGRREPVRLQDPVTSKEGGSSGLWIEVYAAENLADATEDVIEQADFVRAAKSALAHLSSLPLRNPRDRRRYLPDLFRFCVEQVILTGRVSRKEVADHFNCSDTAVYHMFRDLKAELRECGFEPGLI